MATVRPYTTKPVTTPTPSGGGFNMQSLISGAAKFLTPYITGTNSPTSTTATKPKVVTTPTVTSPPTVVPPKSALDIANENIAAQQKKAQEDLDAAIAADKVQTDKDIVAEGDILKGEEDRNNALKTSLDTQEEEFNDTQKAATAARIASINAEFDIAKNALLEQHNQQRELLMDRIGAAGGGNVGSKATEMVGQLQQDHLREIGNLETQRARNIALANSEAFGASASYSQEKRAQIAAAQTALDEQKRTVARNIAELRKNLTASNKATYEKVLSGLQAQASKLQDQQFELDKIKETEKLKQAGEVGKDLVTRRKDATKQITDLTDKIVEKGLTLDPTVSKEFITRIQNAPDPEAVAQEYIQLASTVPAVKAIFTEKAKGSGGGGSGGSTSLTKTQVLKLKALGYTDAEIATPTAEMLQTLFTGERTYTDDSAIPKEAKDFLNKFPLLKSLIKPPVKNVKLYRDNNILNGLFGAASPALPEE